MIYLGSRFVVGWEDTPNAETLEAMEEAERIKSGEQPSKGYTDFDEMMKDMLSD